MRIGWPRLPLWVGLFAATAVAHDCRLGASDPLPPPGAAEVDVPAGPWGWRDEAAKARHAGRVLPRLRPGMTRKDVEARLGPPDHKNPYPRGPGRHHETYFADFGPGAKPDWLVGRRCVMTVVYEPVNGVDVFVHVRGPHIPACGAGNEHGSLGWPVADE